MAEPNYPPNSKAPKSAQQPNTEKPQDKGLKPVANGRVKKKSLTKQFTETFVGGDLKGTAHYVVFDVAIPSFRDLVADSAIQGVERLIFGEARQRGRRYPGPVRGAAGPAPGRINYQGYSSGAPTTPGAPMPSTILQQRQRAKPAPEVGDIDDVILDHRSEAESVREMMFEVLDTHGRASVADFFALAGVPTVHTDHGYGWTDLKGTHVVKNRGGGGYQVIFPDPTAF